MHFLTTYRLARMNLAIRGIFAQLAWNPEGTLLKDAFPDERFDYVMANPLFNRSDWQGDKLRDDRRWTFGAPPEAWTVSRAPAAPGPSTRTSATIASRAGAGVSETADTWVAGRASSQTGCQMPLLGVKAQSS